MRRQRSRLRGQTSHGLKVWLLSALPLFCAGCGLGRCGFAATAMRGLRADSAVGFQRARFAIPHFPISLDVSGRGDGIDEIVMTAEFPEKADNRRVTAEIEEAIEGVLDVPGVSAA